MRRTVLGSLVCAALVAGGGALSGEAATAGSDGTSMRDSQQIAKPKKGRAAAAPLSAADAYKATQADQSAAPLRSTTPSTPMEKPWTGVYVGVNAGAGK